MIRKLTFAIFLLAFALLAQASAQTNALTEKQTAVNELIAITSAENSPKDILDSMSAQMSGFRKDTLKAMLDARTDLTPTERLALEDSMLKDVEAMSKRFEERLVEKLDYNRMITEIAASVYDKNYTLEEIRDLIAFYKTPTGQKTLKLMPTIMSETMQAVMEKLIPRIPVVLQELKDEDRKELEQKLNAKRPRTDKRTS